MMGFQNSRVSSLGFAAWVGSALGMYVKDYAT